jgi:hypothetical protein
MPVTIATLMPLLQARLNDPNHGQWTDEDKRRFINSAHKRTVVQTKCYNTLQSVTLTAGTAEYCTDPVFEPLALRLGDDLLSKVALSSMPIITENWDALAEERPTKWTPMYGAYVRICPAPGAEYTGAISAIERTPTTGGSGYELRDTLSIDEGSGGTVRVAALSPPPLPTSVAAVELLTVGSGYTTGAGKTTTTTGKGAGCTIEITAVTASEPLTVYGPSRVTDLATDDTEITEIPLSHCEEVLLLAAEEEARRARPTMTGSVEVANLLHALWVEQCQDIKRVLGVVG